MCTGVIDRSFMRELGIGSDGVDIVEAITEMAHSLRLEVIADCQAFFAALLRFSDHQIETSSEHADSKCDFGETTGAVYRTVKSPQQEGSIGFIEQVPR